MRIMVWFSKSDEEVVLIRRMVLFGQGISCSCDEKNGLVHCDEKNGLVH